MIQPANRECIVYRAHFYDRVIEHEVRRLVATCGGRKVYLVYDRSANPAPQDCPAEVCSFVLDDIKKLGYAFENLGENYDYPLLWFFRQHAEYSQYWYLDYDVRFTGPWHIFFDAFDPDDGYGLLATHVAVPEEFDYWYHWGRANAEFKNPIRVFYSVARLSNAALSTLERHFAAGLSGFCEYVTPALLLREGFKIGDLWGSPRHRVPYIKRRFYNTLTFHYRPTIYFAGLRRNYLYHPVKHLCRYNRWGLDVVRGDWHEFGCRIERQKKRFRQWIKKWRAR